MLCSSVIIVCFCQQQKIMAYSNDKSLWKVKVGNVCIPKTETHPSFLFKCLRSLVTVFTRIGYDCMNFCLSLSLFSLSFQQNERKGWGRERSSAVQGRGEAEAVAMRFWALFTDHRGNQIHPALGAAKRTAQGTGHVSCSCKSLTTVYYDEKKSKHWTGVCIKQHKIKWLTMWPFALEKIIFPQL